MQVIRSGDWGKARKILDQGTRRIQDATKKGLLQEGHYLRGEMVKGIRDQAPGGRKFKPLSPLTLAARRLKGFGGTKALMVHGDLRNGIRVTAKGAMVFVGILRTARTSKGKRLIDIAEVHEWGANVVLRMTDKMRRFMGVLFREAGRADAGFAYGNALQSWFGRAGGRNVIVIRIPPRPYVRPIFEKNARPADVKKRLEDRMAKLLKGWFAQ